MPQTRQFSLWWLTQLLIAGLFLAVASPLMGVVAVLVKATSAGPVFYVQERVGLRGKRFRLFKFRTMLVNAEQQSGPQWAIENDPRCTRVGGALRRLSLDELPQLLNVLRGDMNLVGPRPERPCFVDQFSREYPEYASRHEVPVGMTGWAQVKGWRGNTSLAERLRCDLYYVRNRSWRMDLHILWLTPQAVLFPTGSRPSVPDQREIALARPQDGTGLRPHRKRPDRVAAKVLP